MATVARPTAPDAGLGKWSRTQGPNGQRPGARCISTGEIAESAALLATRPSSTRAIRPSPLRKTTDRRGYRSARAGWTERSWSEASRPGPHAEAECGGPRGESTRVSGPSEGNLGRNKINRPRRRFPFFYFLFFSYFVFFLF
jgi:hypothetical protein